MKERSLHAQLVGRLVREVAVEGEQLGRRLECVHDGAAKHGRDRIGAELERGDHPEVAAATANRPEQVGVFVGARRHDVSRGEHDLGGDEIVDRHPVAAHQPGEPAAQRQPRDAGAGDHAAGRGEPEDAVRAVELADGDAGLGAHCSSGRVYVDALQG